MNPFQKIKNKLDTKAEQENEQQRQRIERLEQLEAAQNRKGFRIPNPVQSMKDKKEIKQLKKEIAAFEESKRNTKVVIGCVALVAVLICFCVIMSLVENPSQFDNDKSRIEHYQETINDISDSSTSISEPTSLDSQVVSTIESNTGKDDSGFFDWLNEDVPEFEFELSSDGNSYILVDYNSLSPDASNSAEIPATYEGLPVTEIASQAFYACDKLKTVIIPEGIIEIGSYAFYHCGSLENIAFPTTLRRIKEYAFEGCDSFTTIEIHEPASIGFRAFCECEKLETITLGSYENTVSIDKYAFYQCKSLKEATMWGVTSIGDNAFQSCSSLEIVNISNNLYRIGHSAFEYCKSLKEINFKGTAEELGSLSYGHWWNKDTGNYEEIILDK